MDRWRGRLLGARVLVVLLLRVLVVPLGEGAVDNGPLLDASRLEKFVDELPEMPRLRGFRMADGGRLVAGDLAVGMFDTTWKFHRDMPPTRVFAYGTSKEAATVPGPTIEAVHGVPTYVTWTNHLPAHHFLPWDHTITTASPGAGVPTVVHLHGGVQAPSSDGSSLAWFTSNFTTTGPHFRHAASPAYMYSNFQPPGNLWYHDHAMGLTRVNILAGLLGAYRVSSPAEHSFNLPLGAEFDRQLVLLDRAFRSDGSIFINRTGNYPSAHPQWRPEYFGTANIVNGKAWPYLSVRRRLYRFRILNASNARFFRLSFSNGLHFVHVASDSVYLEKPVKTKKFLVAPSEIVDVVVDFSESTTDSAILLNDARFPYPSGDPTDETNGQVMKFVIKRRREHDPSSIPRKLMELPRAEVHEASRTRYITMYEYTEGDDEPVHLYLNARSYLDPVTETPKEGTTEIWNVINLTDDNHPLHVHLAVFAVLEQRSLKRVDEFKECMQGGEGGKEGRNDVHACRLDQHLVGRRHVVPRQERGWKNVFKVRPSMVTKMLVRFKPLSTSSSSEEERFPFNVTAEPGYVYHCHILDHEDNEMMRPMKLVH